MCVCGERKRDPMQPRMEDEELGRDHPTFFGTYRLLPLMQLVTTRTAPGLVFPYPQSCEAM